MGIPVALPDPGADTDSGRRRPADVEERRTRRALLLTGLAVVAVRLVFVTDPIRSDEGGYLLAARSWAPGAGEFLYGDLHVDRPPLLMAFFRLAALWENDAAIRVITIPVVLGVVWAMARTARLLGGPQAARWTAVVAGALLCSPALAADQADGEVFALLFVAGSLATAVHGWREPRSGAALAWGIAAGALAAAAPLVKQSFVDAIVFIAVLTAVTAVPRHDRVTGSGALALGSGIGVLVTWTLAAAWSVRHGLGAEEMWTELVTFRGQAGEVLLHTPGPAEERAVTLVLVAVVSGLLPIVLVWLGWLVRAGRPGRDPLRSGAEQWALGAMLAYGVLGIVLGGSYWLHYLQQVVPGTALAAGLVIAHPGGHSRTMRRLVVGAVGVALLAVATTTVGYRTVPSTWYPQQIGRWVGASAEPGDTMVVAYGSPQVLEAADLPTPYPFLWSLQMRTLDPEQSRLEGVLAGPDAPTWLVVVIPLNSWGIDDDGSLRGLVDQRYRPVAEICGHEVLLRTDVVRRLAEVPSCR